MTTPSVTSSPFYFTQIAIKKIDQFQSSDSFFKRHLASRVMSVAIIVFATMDTTRRAFQATLCLTGSFARLTVGWIRFPKFKAVRDYIPENLNMKEFKHEAFKTFFFATDIIIGPTLNLIKPKLSLRFHEKVGIQHCPPQQATSPKVCDEEAEDDMPLPPVGSVVDDDTVSTIGDNSPYTYGKTMQSPPTGNDLFSSSRTSGTKMRARSRRRSSSSSSTRQLMDRQMTRRYSDWSDDSYEAPKKKKGFLARLCCCFAPSNKKKKKKSKKIYGG